uniref:Uncharacterized protein n=1 Tax=Marseillevirus LCMAC101 TaxID=2506602 RepID=A0A481YSK1_9VIRU|nr:MAG: hypothetical protein LCMAC101_00430 [Marseillevirus LCMAC101]
MVFTHVLVIRGILLSKEEVYGLENGEIDYGDEVQLLMEKYDGLVGQFDIHEWPCCSPLQHERFILGKIVGKYNIIKMYEEIVTSDSIESKYDFDSELELISKGYGFSGSPRNYFLLDNCLYCS